MQHLLQIIKSRYKRSIFQEHNKVNIPLVYRGKSIKNDREVCFKKVIDIFIYGKQNVLYDDYIYKAIQKNER